ncbi:basic proline-rich protein-like [Sarcophilus harrisii]|uniref:basic proline-rich protein-like n=1 Tax=Sarcophilus harrisii TaxID=9305 RepID=UPI001301E69D|nr:basic proline-rich protein-like [Sarcophilus harrisii]
MAGRPHLRPLGAARALGASLGFWGSDTGSPGIPFETSGCRVPVPPSWDIPRALRTQKPGSKAHGPSIQTWGLELEPPPGPSPGRHGRRPLAPGLPQAHPEKRTGNPRHQLGPSSGEGLGQLRPLLLLHSASQGRAAGSASRRGLPRPAEQQPPARGQVSVCGLTRAARDRTEPNPRTPRLPHTQRVPVWGGGADGGKRDISASHLGRRGEPGGRICFEQEPGRAREHPQPRARGYLLAQSSLPPPRSLLLGDRPDRALGAPFPGRSPGCCPPAGPAIPLPAEKGARPALPDLPAPPRPRRCPRSARGQCPPLGPGQELMTTVSHPRMAPGDR